MKFLQQTVQFFKICIIFLLFYPVQMRVQVACLRSFRASFTLPVKHPHDKEYFECQPESRTRRAGHACDVLGLDQVTSFAISVIINSKTNEISCAHFISPQFAFSSNLPSTSHIYQASWIFLNICEYPFWFHEIVWGCVPWEICSKLSSQTSTEAYSSVCEHLQCTDLIDCLRSSRSCLH